MTDSLTLATIAATFALAGMVKGVIGLGLPTISLALLTVALDLTSAMVLLLAPSFVTNLWQALSGNNAPLLVRRLWPFLLFAFVTVWLGAAALGQIDERLLSALLGFLLIIYAGLSLVGVRLSISMRNERWLGPFLGAVNGILTGMTGSFVVPGAMYLQAIALPREQLVQAMGILFTLSTLALAAALQGNRLLGSDLGMVSIAAVAPAIIGMLIGQRLRRALSEQQFRKVFFLALLLLGIYIISTSLLST